MPGASETRSKECVLGPEHPRCGTTSTYVYRRCSGAKCDAARRVTEAARNAAREPLADDDPRHGTSKGYKTGRCRGPRCKAWNAAAAAARKVGEPVPEQIPGVGP